MIKNILTILLILAVATSCAQINSFNVAPNQTDINYAANQDSHLVVRNTTTNLNRLFLFLGGTGSNPKFYKIISNFAGSLGYDVINLSYNNSVAAASLANSPDSLAFNKYRQEVCYGTPQSPDVTVDTLNSIYTRTINILNYLNVTFPDQNWGQYLDSSGVIDWSRIIVAGHSQGSGHACYFGKLNLVDRILLFSGPNDYSIFFSNSANWLRTPGLTNIEKHFSYLSLLDEAIDYEIQLINIQGLNLYPTYDTTYVDPSKAPYNHSHCLYTRQPPGLTILNHNSPVKFSIINNAVWTYMLNSTIISDVKTIVQKNPFQLYPNPTSSIVNIISVEKFKGKRVKVLNQSGQVLKSENITSQNSMIIDLSNLPNGFYFIEIDSQIMKIIKY